MYSNYFVFPALYHYDSDSYIVSIEKCNTAFVSSGDPGINSIKILLNGVSLL